MKHEFKLIHKMDLLNVLQSLVSIPGIDTKTLQIVAAAFGLELRI